MLLHRFIINRITFLIIPFLVLSTVIVLHFEQNGLSRFGLPEILLVGLLFLILIFIYNFVSEIFKRNKLKKTILKEKILLDSDEKTVIRTKLKLGEKFLYLNEDSLNVLDKDSKWVLKFKKREKLLIRKNIFCDSSINIKDVNYLILEYDNYVHFTFLGIISRGLFDRSNSFNNISAQLNSGRIIKLFHFNFSDTIYSESINPLAFEDDFEQDFDAFPLGKTAVELISKILQKPYMIINYKSPD